MGWSADSDAAFAAAKVALASAAMLAHPSPDAPIAITADALDYVVSAVHKQWINSTWQPLVFFCQLRPAERQYSTFVWELLLCAWLFGAVATLLCDVSLRLTRLMAPVVWMLRVFALVPTFVRMMALFVFWSPGRITLLLTWCAGQSAFRDCGVCAAPSAGLSSCQA